MAPVPKAPDRKSRLKEIVDQSRHRPADYSQLLLYLFDEILQGTNSVERHVAVEREIGRPPPTRSSCSTAWDWASIAG